MPDLKPDVVRLILSDHESFRARFAELATLRAEPQAAAALWTGLAADLERHASAEEAHFYPALLKDVDDSEDETKDAIGDHDEILTGGAARSPALCIFDESDAATGIWRVEQIIDDPAGDHDWRIRAEVDLETFVGRRLRATVRRKENGYNQIIAETAAPLGLAGDEDD